jgi:hypothetical protein
VPSEEGSCPGVTGDSASPLTGDVASLRNMDDLAGVSACAVAVLPPGNADRLALGRLKERDGRPLDIPCPAGAAMNLTVREALPLTYN